MTSWVGRALLGLSKGVALAGGAVLLGLTTVSVYSIIGRAISRNEVLRDLAWLSWWRAIRGHFELIELGTAVAIFAFLPYCQMVRGNVLVDFFTSRANARAKAALALFANALYSVLALLFTWRMALATSSLQVAAFPQTSMILRIPLWWGYLAATLCMALLSAACLFTVWRSLREALGEGEPVHEPA